MATHEKMKPGSGSMSTQPLPGDPTLDAETGGAARSTPGSAAGGASTKGAPASGSPMSGASGRDTATGAAQGAQTSQSPQRSTMAGMADAARQTGSQAQDAAASLAAQAKDNVKGMLNQQVSAGADVIERIADSTRTAADGLHETSPHLADFVRGAADRIEHFSRDLRDQTVDDLVRTASDYARRRPAVVFGAAAAVGFLVLRIATVSAADGQRQSRRPRVGDDDWSSRMGSSAGYGNDYARTDQIDGR